MAAQEKRFYVYEILDSANQVIYVGKGVNKRVNASLKERNGASFNIVKYFEYEHKAFEFEVKHIAKFNNLLNANKGGFGGTVLKGDKETRLMNEIGTKAYSARMLFKYYLTFKALASKVDDFYSKELQNIFNNMNPSKLYEVGYGTR